MIEPKNRIRAITEIKKQARLFQNFSFWNSYLEFSYKKTEEGGLTTRFPSSLTPSTCGKIPAACSLVRG
jgi:hypothetical protein